MNKKIIAITGSGGLGTAAAQNFLAAGWQVFILSQTSGVAGCEFIECDITRADQVETSFKKIPFLDAFIHTAVSRPVIKKIFALSREEFLSSFEVDVFGGFNVIKKAAEVMKGTAGSILALGSLYAETGVPHPSLAGYVSAKLALRGFLRQLHEELAGTKLRVNMLAPGLVPVGLNKDMPEAVVNFMAEKMPKGFVQSPAEVAEALFEITNDQAVNGLFIPLNSAERSAL